MPRRGHFPQLPLRRTAAEIEGIADCRTKRHIARRKDIRMAAAEHEIHFRGPEPDALYRRQSGNRVGGGDLGESNQIEFPRSHSLGNAHKGLRLGPGKSELPARSIVGGEIVFRCDDTGSRDYPTPDRLGACLRDHLRNDDMRKARKAGLIEPQWYRPGGVRNPGEPWIGLCQCCNTDGDVSVVADAVHSLAPYTRSLGTRLRFVAEGSMIAIASQKPVFRFAPSPNGPLHLGHALSAILNHDMARATDGRFLLRIEDIDRSRCLPEFEALIYADLAWIGLSWEEPVRRQSQHFADYGAALDRLVDRGLAYPSFMSRGEVKARVAAYETHGASWPRDPDGSPHYPADDREMGDLQRRKMLDSGRKHAWRLDMARALASLDGELDWLETGDGRAGRTPADPAAWGDVVLSRSDAPSSYHLSVVVDDALQGVTHVVRGMDLYCATAVHRLLQRLLDLPEPVYCHHRLIAGPDGRKLSKSLGDTGLAQLRENGASPLDIRRLIGL